MFTEPDSPPGWSWPAGGVRVRSWRGRAPRGSSRGCSSRSWPAPPAHPVPQPHRPARRSRAQRARPRRWCRPSTLRVATAVPGGWSARRRGPPPRRGGRARGGPGRRSRVRAAGAIAPCLSSLLAGVVQAAPTFAAVLAARRSPGLATEALVQQRQQDDCRPAGRSAVFPPANGLARSRLPARPRAGARCSCGWPAGSAGAVIANSTCGRRASRAPRRPAPRPRARHPQRDRPHAWFTA